MTEQWPLPRLLRGETVRNLDLRLRRLDTDWERTFSYGGTLVRDATGQDLAVLTITDITERMRAVELANANAALQLRERQTRLVRDIASAANAARSADDVLQVALDSICGYTGWPIGHVYVSAGDGTCDLISSKRWHLDDAERYRGFCDLTDTMRFRIGQGLPGRIFSTRQPAWIPNVNDDNNLPRSVMARELGAEGAFGFPVMVGDKVAAVLEFFFPAAQAPDQGFPDFMVQVSLQLSILIERKHAEDALHESEERYRSLVDLAPDIIYRLHEDGTIAFISAAITRLGYDASELIGKPFMKIVHPDDRDKAKNQCMEHRVGDRRTKDLQIRLLMKQGGGHEVDFELHYRAIALHACGAWDVPDAEISRPDKHFLYTQGIARDITERKRAEDALRASEAHFRSLMETSPVAMMITSGIDEHVLTANTQFTCLFGYTIADIPDVAHWWELAYPDAHYRETIKATWTAQMAKAIQEQTPIPAMETLVTGKDGMIHVIEIHASSIGDWNFVVFIDLTQQKATQSALEQLTRAIEHSPASVVITSKHGTIEYVNPKFTEVTGYTAEEAIGQNPRILNSRVQPVEFYTQMWRTISAGLEWHGEFCNRKKNGELYWENASISSIKNEQGKITHYVAVKEDITERKRAEAVVAEQRMIFERIIEQAMAGYWDWNIPEQTTYLSPRFKSMFGYEDHELPNAAETWQNLMLPEDLPGLLETYRQHVESHGQVPYYNEIRYRHKDGSIVWVICTGDVIQWDDKGQPVRMIGCHFDITERKRVEEALRRSEDQLRLLLDSTAEAIYGIDPDDNCTFCNPACLNLLGYMHPEELIGKNMHWLIHHHLPDGTPFPIEDCQIYRVFLQGEGIHVEDEVFWRADGTSFPAEYWSYPQRRDGVTVGAVVAFIDITARKQVAEELNKAKDAADAANRAKSAFLANMSHEIRTPMNAILGFAQLLQRDPAVTPHQRQQIDTINHSGEYLLTLINDILEMAKIEAGRTTVNLTTCDLPALVGDLEAMFRLHTDVKRLSFSVTYLGKLPRYVLTDESKLRQILINLVGNAVKFTQYGGITIRVGVRREMPELRLWAEVEDTGPGIAEEELRHLFQPFSQTSSGAHVQGGTGLGLAISREFACLLDGDITVSSQVGAGSIFRVEIAVAEGTDAIAEPTTESLCVVGLQPGQPIYRLLVVDDKAENRLLLTQMLSGVGFETREAVNGEEAIEAFTTWNPHLILMDLRMPVVDGYEATRRIRTAEGGRDVKIVAVTASAFTEDRLQVMDIGADDFIGKPFREATSKRLRNCWVCNIY